MSEINHFRMDFRIDHKSTPKLHAELVRLSSLGNGRGLGKAVKALAEEALVLRQRSASALEAAGSMAQIGSAVMKQMGIQPEEGPVTRQKKKATETKTTPVDKKTAAPKPEQGVRSNLRNSAGVTRVNPSDLVELLSKDF